MLKTEARSPGSAFCALKCTQGRTPSPDLKQKERDKRTAQGTAFEKPVSFVMIKEGIMD